MNPGTTYRSYRYRKSSIGFTLVELMVVISIVSMLSGIIAVSVSASKARAQDTAKAQNLAAIQKALTLAKADIQNVSSGAGGTTSGPPTGDLHTSGTTIATITSPQTILFYDVPGDQAQFVAIVQDLVDQKRLTSMPSDLTGMFYFNGPDPQNRDNTLTIIGAKLKTLAPTEVAPSGTCRPFSKIPPPGFCSNDIPSQDYCLCI